MSFILHNIIVAILAYSIDRIFGEFAFRHPILYIGDVIRFFEKIFYKKSILNGAIFVCCVLFVIAGVSFVLIEYLTQLHPLFEIVFESFIASMFIAHKMLRDEVAKILVLEDIQKKKEQIATLVSRDTQNMNESDIYKAAVETYAENLSDGVIAPLFYLLFFGLAGIIIYKTINTLDSMVGYKNEKYEKFGKVAAKLDDIANFIPARITAFLIMILAKKTPFTAFFEDGKKHESPNAGLPITAMALALGVKLGGPTSYFGKIKQKPFFGKGREDIKKQDLQKALELL